MKKFERKDKNEKRRLAFEKRNVKNKMNLTHYGAEGGSALVAKTSDFNRRFVAAFLALVFALTTLVLGINIAANAESVSVPSQNILFLKDSELDADGYKMETIPNNNNGMFLSKGLRNNGNGQYDLKIETYATGDSEKIPTDFVLVLDQSGSMAYKDMPTGEYTAVTKSDWKMSDISIDEASGDAYYYYDESSGNYYRVFLRKGYMYEYFEGNKDLWTGNLGLDGYYRLFANTSVDKNNSTAFYYYDSNTNNYYKVLMKVIAKLGEYAVELSYKDESGNSVPLSRPPEPLYRNWGGIGTAEPDDWYYDAVQLFCLGLAGDSTTAYTYGELGIGSLKAKTGMYISQNLYKRHLDYKEMCYKDDEGVVHTLIGANFCNSNGTPLTDSNINGIPGNSEPTWSGTLYKPDNNTETRLQSLNSAAKEFIDQVAEQTNSRPDGTLEKVNHKIAVVGFSSQGTPYNNSELLSPDTEVSTPSGSYSGYSLDNKAHNGPQYGSSSISSKYSSALVSTANETGKNSLKKSIDYVTAYGGTQPELGFEMALNILEGRSETTYTTLNGTTAKRNMCVIFFTDGRPGDYASSNQFSEANDVVSSAKMVKDYGATVYSIGVFGESDGNPLTYIKHKITDYNYYQTTNYPNYSVEGDNYQNLLDYYPLFEGDYDHTDIHSQSGLKKSWTQIGSSTYYFADVYARMWEENETGFPTTPTDTIADYMSVVSSKYPNATKFVDDNWYDSDQTKRQGTYEQMTDNVRKQPVEGKYYYLASNTASLKRAFADIFQSQSTALVDYNSTNSFIRDVITDAFDTSQASLTIKSSSVTAFDADTGKPSEWGELSEATNVISDWHKGEKAVNVTGFDFSKYYVSPYNKSDSGTFIGKKIVIELSGITTTQSGILQSNSSASGIYRAAYDVTDEHGTTTIPEANENPFPIPSTTRFRYTLNVTGDNQEADISSLFKLLTNGTENPQWPTDLKMYTGDGSVSAWENKVPLSYNQLASVGNSFQWVAHTSNGERSVWIEDLPPEHTLLTSHTNNDAGNEYNYSIDLDGNNSSAFIYTEAKDYSMPRNDSTINIKSETKSRVITIHLTASDSPFISNDHAFIVNVSWPDNEGMHSESIVMPYDNGQIADKMISVPYGSTVTVSHEDFFYDTQISKEGFDLGTAEPVTIENISADGDIYITDKARSNIGEGIPEETKPTRILLYSLAGLAMVSGGAGVAYVYRKKDEFVEQ